MNTGLSLAGSGTLYLQAQVRVVDAGHCRYQVVAAGHGIEVTVKASAVLTTWLSTVPATAKSNAGTGAMYAPCQVHPDTDGIRVQVAGPTALNAPFGAEYTCHGWPDTDGQIAAALGVAPDAAPAVDDEGDEE